MTATLRHIALQWIRKKSGGNRSRDNQYDENYIIWLVRACVAEVLKGEYWQGVNAEGDSSVPPQLLVPFTLTVLPESSTGRMYVQMPEAWLNLPYSRGIREIRTLDNPEKHRADASRGQSQRRIILRHHPEISNLHPVSRLGTFIGAYIQGQNIYFDENVKEANIKKVMVYAVVPASQTYGADDVLPLPSELIPGILDRLDVLYQDKGLQDKFNDTNADIGTAINKGNG